MRKSFLFHSNFICIFCSVRKPKMAIAPITNSRNDCVDVFSVSHKLRLLNEHVFSVLWCACKKVPKMTKKQIKNWNQLWPYLQRMETSNHIHVSFGLVVRQTFRFDLLYVRIYQRLYFRLIIYWYTLPLLCSGLIKCFYFLLLKSPNAKAGCFRIEKKSWCLKFETLKWLVEAMRES